MVDWPDDDAVALRRNSAIGGRWPSLLVLFQLNIHEHSSEEIRIRDVHRILESKLAWFS